MAEEEKRDKQTRKDEEKAKKADEKRQREEEKRKVKDEKALAKTSAVAGVAAAGATAGTAAGAEGGLSTGDGPVKSQGAPPTEGKYNDLEPTSTEESNLERFDTAETGDVAGKESADLSPDEAAVAANATEGEEGYKRKGGRR